MQLPRYDSYKDSGVEWLGEIPEKWNVMRNIGIFDERKIINHPEKELLSVTIERGVIKQSEITTKKDSSNEDKSKYKLLKPGDLAYNKMRMWQGAVGMSEHEGIVSPAYIILSPRDKAYSRYFHYLLRSDQFLVESNRLSYGLCDDMNSLRYEDFKGIYTPLPPKDTMTRIVSFLDQKTAEIDEAIAKKQKLIELLQEQKSILINQAVTKGLNPDAPMKDSGVEWIGEIPAHWKSYRLKFTFNRIEQGWSPQCFNYVAEEDAWGVLKVGCVNGYTFNPQENKVLPPNLKPRTNLELQHNDILISRANTLDLVGSAARVIHPRKKLILCDKLYRVRANENIILPDFFIFALQTRKSREQIQLGANGASDTMQNIGQDVIKNLWIPVPPVYEQAAILTKLGSHSQLINDTIRKFGEEIQALLELKQSLISSAVTGKIKV